MAGRPRRNPEFPPPPPETLGARLASERRRIGLTQQQLADALGVALSNLRNYEQDRNSLRSALIERMRNLRIDVDYVIFGRDPAALGPIDAALWDWVKAWDAKNSKDAEGNELNEYARYQRITLFYRWLHEGRGEMFTLDDWEPMLDRTRTLG